MSLDKPVLAARKPTAAVPYPFVLIEGEEKAGKTWAAALLSKSERVGTTYWLDLGEGSADEYGAIPGTRYLILEHDGTYAAVLEQVLAVKAEAARAKAAGEAPVVLVIDSMTDLWDGLKDWVSARAKAKPADQRKLAADPAAELDVSRNLWNDAGNRYRRLVTQLLTFPGIVVVTARGKEVSATDPATGQPYRDGRKEYRVEGHKTVAYDASVWIRMSRAARPLVVGARSVHVGIKPGHDEPKPITEDPDNLLDWLIFDVLRCDPATAHVRDLRNVTGGELLEHERAEEEEQEARDTRAAQARPATRAQRPAQQAQRPPQQPAEQAPAPAPRQERPTAQRPAQEATPAPTAPGIPATLEEATGLALDVARTALDCTDVDKLRATFREARDRTIIGLDVFAALGDDDLAALAIETEDDGTTVLTLGALLMSVAKYVERHGAAVRDLGEPLPPAPAEELPEDPWATDEAPQN